MKERSPSSERRGARTAGRVVLAGALAAAALIAAVPPGLGGERNDTWRFEGEYGLTVRFEGDSVRVGWLTVPPRAGTIQVLSRGRIHFETTTPADSAHAATFRNPGRDTMVLRYGGAGDDALHATTVDLRTGRKRDDVRFSAADSIFVVGDIHGEFDTLVAVLRNAGVIDADGRWAGGESRFAVLGDMTDRGADVTRTLWFLYRLEREADEAGGQVHVLLGNHEVMVLLDDLRYVGAKEAALARLHGYTYDRLFDPRISVLGRWLAAKPALIRIGDVLLTHGGISPALLPYTLESVDDTLGTFIAEDLFYRWSDSTYLAPLDTASYVRRWNFFWDENSIFWYRGFALAATLTTPLDLALDRFRGRILVVGHTPGEDIRQAYDGRFIMTNTLPFAAQVLLLVRSDDRWLRFRIGSTGPPVPLL